MCDSCIAARLLLNAVSQDAYALLLCAHDPQVELLGVSTVHGNAALDQTTYNTRAILEAVGRRDVKVYSGAAKPIARDAVHAVDIHGTYTTQSSVNTH